MQHYQIGVIPGDGIGRDVTREALRVLSAVSEVISSFALEYEVFPWGSEYHASHGRMMPSHALKTLEEFDAIYFGAVGSPSVPDHVTLHGLRLEICQGFDQYVSLRPAILLPGVQSPLCNIAPNDVDLVVVRENTEGEYSGAGGRVHRGLPEEVGLEIALFSKNGISRVAEYAFSVAEQRDCRRLAYVTKSNAQRHGFLLWDEVCEGVAAEHPSIATERVLVDAMAARFVLQPETLDVVLASNLHGDILSDLAGAICGSLGMAPSGNINPERHYPSMFEPIHGSAPDISGSGIANPVAMIWSGAMMLEFLGETEASGIVLSGIRDVLSENENLTPDIGGKASTVEVGDAIVRNIQAIAA